VRPDAPKNSAKTLTKNEENSDGEMLSRSEAIKLIRDLLADKSNKSQGQTTPSQIIDEELDDKPEVNPVVLSDGKNCTALVVVPDSKAADSRAQIVHEVDLEHVHLPVERPNETIVAPQEFRPASIVNPMGNLVCNFLQHRVMAGCTAIVALIIDDRLLVANAGEYILFSCML
jgi:hypothetical protein